MDVALLPFLHRWFGLFERGPAVPVSRVLAAGTGAVVTAVGMGAATRSRWWAHLFLAVVTWALLGKIEGDARDTAAGGGSDPDEPRRPPGGVREPRRPTPTMGSGAAAAPA